MHNYITKLITVTQLYTPVTLTSLLLRPPSTGKRTPSQPVPLEPTSIENGAHGTEKLPLKTQVSENFYSEVNLNIYYHHSFIYFSAS